MAAKLRSSASPRDSTAAIGFEAKLWLTAEQAVPAPHFTETDLNGGRPQGLLGLIFLFLRFAAQRAKLKAGYNVPGQINPHLTHDFRH